MAKTVAAPTQPDDIQLPVIVVMVSVNLLPRTPLAVGKFYQFATVQRPLDSHVSDALTGVLFAPPANTCVDLIGVTAIVGLSSFGPINRVALIGAGKPHRRVASQSS